jgi:hypothetical protein
VQRAVRSAESCRQREGLAARRREWVVLPPSVEVPVQEPLARARRERLTREECLVRRERLVLSRRQWEASRVETPLPARAAAQSTGTNTRGGRGGRRGGEVDHAWCSPGGCPQLGRERRDRNEAPDARGVDGFLEGRHGVAASAQGGRALDARSRAAVSVTGLRTRQRYIVIMTFISNRGVNLERICCAGLALASRYLGPKDGRRPGPAVAPPAPCPSYFIRMGCPGHPGSDKPCSKSLESDTS